LIKTPTLQGKNFLAKSLQGELSELLKKALEAGTTRRRRKRS